MGVGVRVRVRVRLRVMQVNWADERASTGWEIAAAAEGLRSHDR